MWAVMSALFILMIVVAPSIAGALTLTDTTKIDEFIKSFRECHLSPGLSIGLVTEGRNVHTRAYGMADIEKNINVTASTRFCIASTTKAFTATLLGKLLDNHDNYTWDTPVHRILGDDFELKDPEITKRVTIRDLLSHKVGIARHDNIWLLGTAEDSSEIMRRLKYLDFEFGFRERYLYNNIMYMVAGKVAEKLGAKPWEALIKEHLLEPLGMNATEFIHLPKDNWNTFAKPYEFDTYDLRFRRVALEQISEVGLVSAAGSICSSAEDITKWMKFHLNHGRNDDGHQLVSVGTLGETYEGNVATSPGFVARPTFPVTYAMTNYGMGWKSGFYRGYPMLSHTGGLAGYKTLLALVPSEGIGVFITANNYVDRTLPLFYILDVLLAEEPWLNASTVCSFPKPWMPDHNDTTPSLNITEGDPARDLAAYTGQYGNAAQGRIYVYLNGSNNLKLQYGRRGDYQLIPSNIPDVFIADGTGLNWFRNLGYAIFLQSESGKKLDRIRITALRQSESPLFVRDWRPDFLTTQGPSTTRSSSSGAYTMVKFNVFVLSIVLYQIFR